jgi:hypothetical protein
MLAAHWLWFCPVAALALSQSLLFVTLILALAPMVVVLDRPLPAWVHAGTMVAVSLLSTWLTPFASVVACMLPLLPSLLHPVNAMTRVEQYVQFTLKVAFFVHGLIWASCTGIPIAIVCRLVPSERGNANHYTGKVLRCVTRAYLGITYTLTSDNDTASDGTLGIPSPPNIPMANHQSALDIVHIATHWPHRLCIVAKDIMFWYPLLGQFMWFVPLSICINRRFQAG